MTVPAKRALWICLAYCASGCAGLIYETVWIRAFALSFGNTLLSFSTVISVFLGGLAIGAAIAGRLRHKRPLTLYGVAELWIACYALAIPKLMHASTRLLTHIYGAAGEGAVEVALARAVLCAAILLPATIPMGAVLPWLFSALAYEGPNAPRPIWVYALNSLGGAAGAVLAGFVLLPVFGYWRTLLTASLLDGIVGVAAIALSRWPARILLPPPDLRRSNIAIGAAVMPRRTLVLVVFCSGWAALLYEVTAARVTGLLFGPTAVTVTMTLAVVLLGLAAGSLAATWIPKLADWWLPTSQIAAAVLMLAGSCLVAVSPVWLADEIRAHANDAARMELFEAALIFLALFPLMTAAGMALPLAMSCARRSAESTARVLGGLYAVNTLGCIAGALAAGWFLIPRLGAERTLYSGVVVNAAIGAALLPRLKWRAAGIGVGALAVAALAYPQWDMAAMTSGAYKYATYYSGPAIDELHHGEMQFLREGQAGTVTVRRAGESRVLAIDGKVDATDGGGDLLTEKLLAHIPLSLLPNPKNICVIGLASGVTAGAALTYPVQRMDVLEVSKEVVEASKLFNSASGRPLDSSRTHLIVNDGRNHLELTTERYDAILSEPSNPWIAGMNALFTRDFFRIARSRLTSGGVLAQWFHLYSMPPDDLRSLLRAFVEVFPSAMLWQLNEGDVLLTGMNTESSSSDARALWSRSLPPAAVADLAVAGVSEPRLLATLYVMRGPDLAAFAGTAEPNTDDLPVLEFHGQRDLDLQTSEQNIAALAAFPQRVAPPADVLALKSGMTAELLAARGKMFEQGESYQLAFDSYQKALTAAPADSAALAGMLRCARTQQEVAAAGTLATRTEEALADARKGDAASAEWLLRSVKEAWPERPEAQLNYGLFCFDQSRYQDAIASFAEAIRADRRYLPAYEAMAKTYLRQRDIQNAALWSHRILGIDPEHAAARQALALLQQQGAAGVER